MTVTLDVMVSHLPFALQIYKFHMACSFYLHKARETFLTFVS